MRRFSVQGLRPHGLSLETTAQKVLLPLGVIAALLVGWQVASATGAINSTLFPAPTDIWAALRRVHERDPDQSLLLTHIWATLQRLFWATILGTMAGMVAGGAMGLNRLVYRALDPLITVIMPIPGIALAPLFIIWLGFGDRTIITVGAIAVFFPVVYNTASGVRTVDDQLVRAARTMGAGRFATVANVHFPWSLAYVLLGFKLGLARGWRTVVAVELIASTNWGLGYMIWDAAEYLQSAVVYGGILVMIVVYFVLDRFVIAAIERQTISKWGMLREL